ncbi:hypothetical protein [Pseudomonas syringae]|uniref:hypothetical protein n=1 Tax=Pseudomonas syringae TaxID=317 RepID=UPI0011AFB941|nr:hypothetical protein [Pseudomonas syringae]
MSSRFGDRLGKLSRKMLLGSSFCDVFVPWAVVESEGQKNRRAEIEDVELTDTKSKIANAEDDVLKALLEDYESILESNEDRQRSVDSRLSTIVGLSSIAATITTGVIIAQAAGTVNLPLGIWRWGLSIVALYLVVQLCDAIHWAIRGQERQSYLGHSIQGILPEPGITAQDYHRTRILNTVKRIHVNRASVNVKVTAMAVAHRAAKNFIAGLLVLSLTGMVMMGNEHKAPSVVDSLRSDHELRELLTGPTGPPGIPGLQGPPGKDGKPAQQGTRGGAESMGISKNPTHPRSTAGKSQKNSASHNQ